MSEPYNMYFHNFLFLEKDTDKVVKTYPMAIPDKQKTIIQREAQESGYNFETGGKYLSRLYDKKTWNYGKYITEPLDNFPVKGIVVKLSGGADSSIVYYRLCMELAERGLDYPVVVVTLDPETKDWYSHYAKKVISFTRERTGIFPLVHRVEKLPLPWTVPDYEKAQDQILANVLEDGLANVYYGGLTQNPDAELMAKEAFDVDGIKFTNFEKCLAQAKDRDPGRDNNQDKDGICYGVGGEGPLAETPFLGLLPFVHKDKKHGTAAMYKEMGVLDELLPLTYSCENEKPEEKTKLDIVSVHGTPMQEYSHCGQCWFCLERAYAFGRLV